jgi:hypothetical protein
MLDRVNASVIAWMRRADSMAEKCLSSSHAAVLSIGSLREGPTRRDLRLSLMAKVASFESSLCLPDAATRQQGLDQWLLLRQAAEDSERCGAGPGAGLLLWGTASDK